MAEKKTTLVGLTSEQVRDAQQQYGKNILTAQKTEGFFRKALRIIAEPMFILLLAAAGIYFLLGNIQDGLTMLVFVLVIIGIDLVQGWKTDRTLRALRDLSAPKITVIRDGEEQEIFSSELVPGDLMLIYEGVKIPADGVIVDMNDLNIDESILTGESEGVWKTLDHPASNDYWRKDYCYAGTMVSQGNAVVRVEKIGDSTEYGKIGASLQQEKESRTPLQKQVDKLVKICAIIAAGLFVTVGVITFFNDMPGLTFGQKLVDSILSGVTVAMAMIPQEFPVILTVFLSMGAWRLAKKKSLVRNLPAAETLGAISVLCVDKTGTITMNQMTVQQTWVPGGDEKHFCNIMGMACETEPYDPMEKAMLAYAQQKDIDKEALFSGKLLMEYPFTREQKMMGHVWQKDGNIRVTAKGSPERILSISTLSDAQKMQAEQAMEAMTKEGLRVIGVGHMPVPDVESIPATIYECHLTLDGIVGLTDPPRPGVKQDIETCTQAGIRVVMVTGDNGQTASAIAGKVSIPGSDQIVSGDAISELSDEQLQEKVKTTSIFARVIPEHKLRIVRAFQSNGEVVAMTGDGVNDAPALKASDIGIAMGLRGSEVSREASDLVLLDDNFSTIVDTVRDGRRIYDNIRKAIGYVIAIHLPIALSSLLAPILGVLPASVMLLPVHIMLLQLVIDPTCSIVLERQPAESNIMSRPPRDPNANVLSGKTLAKSILQGVVLFVAIFGLYYFTLLQNPDNAPLARSMAISTFMMANLFLVLVNSSNYDSMIRTLVRMVKDPVMWALYIGTILALILALYTPLNQFLRLAPLSAMQFLLTLAVAALVVFWYELVKIGYRRKGKRLE